MSDYTPSMDEIRADWVTLKAARELGQDVPSTYWHAFDRAIAAHDAELRAEIAAAIELACDNADAWTCTVVDDYGRVGVPVETLRELAATLAEGTTP